MSAVMRRMCKTCPFREDSPIRHAEPYLAKQSLVETRLCHSTGGNDTVIDASKNYTKKEKVCRGSRDLQLKIFVGMGFLTEATDEAWDAKCAELGIVPNGGGNPEKG